MKDPLNPQTFETPQSEQIGEKKFKSSILIQQLGVGPSYLNSCGYISYWIFHKVLQECITKWESKQLGKQGMIYFPTIVIPKITLEPAWAS